MKDPELIMPRMRLLYKWMDEDGVNLKEWDRESERWCATPHRNTTVDSSDESDFGTSFDPSFEWEKNKGTAGGPNKTNENSW